MTATHIFRKKGTAKFLKVLNDQDPSGTYVWFLLQALNISSLKYLDEEITFLIDILTENWHSRTKLEYQNKITKCIQISIVNAFKISALLNYYGYHNFDQILGLSQIQY